MSQVKVSGNASGTGIFEIAAPNTNTNRTLTLPDNTGTLVSTGSSGVVTPTMLSQPLTSGTAVASTSGTSIDFTSIPSWVKRITVMFNGVSTNGSTGLLLRVGTGGTVATTNYFSTASYASGAGAFLFAAQGFTLDVGNSVGASTLRYGALQLSLIGSNTWCLSGNLSQGSAGQVSLACAGTTPALSGALDQIRITTGNGTDTFDAGSINILYE